MPTNELPTGISESLRERAREAIAKMAAEGYLRTSFDPDTGELLYFKPKVSQSIGAAADATINEGS